MLSEWSLLAKVITIWVLSVKSCLVLKETGFCFVLLFEYCININYVILYYYLLTTMGTGRASMNTPSRAQNPPIVCTEIR
jgi:hypothetical protein